MTRGRKWVLRLIECENCGLLFRHPLESQEAMTSFYQKAYRQPGLTTGLPEPEQLERLAASRFAATEKSASPILALLHLLGLGPGARILDYGSNWGYTVFQLRAAGYRCEGYEPAVERADFAKLLGVQQHVSLATVKGTFDVVLSSHVLEHVRNPKREIERQLSLLGAGGLVIGLTPNGSSERRISDPSGFRLAWGVVHPVLLTDSFLACSFPGRTGFIGSDLCADGLGSWSANRQRWARGPLDGAELCFVMA